MYLKDLTFDLVNNEGWEREWPTTTGQWWFCGWRFGKISCGHEAKPELVLVNVKNLGKPASGRPESIVYIADGGFMYPEEKAVGFWKKMEPISLPDLTQL